MQRRDLKAELAAAERVAQDKKRKAAGLPPLLPSADVALGIEAADDEGAKRRKLLEEALEADKEDESDSEEEEENDEEEDSDE